MSTGARDEPGDPDELEVLGRDLEAMIDYARTLDPRQLKALIRLVRQALAEQDAAF